MHIGPCQTAMLDILCENDRVLKYKSIFIQRQQPLQTRNYKHHTNESKSSERYIGPCQTAMLEILCEK